MTWVTEDCLLIGGDDNRVGWMSQMVLHRVIKIKKIKMLHMVLQDNKNQKIKMFVDHG